MSQLGSEGSEDGQFEGPTRVAVDSTGQIYVLDGGNLRIERFTNTGTFEEVVDPTDVFFPQEIAVGPSNDHLYVAQWAQDFSEHHVIEIDAAGSLVDTHGVGSSVNQSSGLALSSTDQKIYWADGYSRFETVPDAPISSFELKLPEGPFSALTATAPLCAKTITSKRRVTRRLHGHNRKVIVKSTKLVPTSLVMPTTITAQNGAVLHQSTKIAVSGCPKAKKVKKPRRVRVRRRR